MGYLWQIFWDIFGKIWDIISKNYGIYQAKTIGNFMGYIRQKVWNILSKNYGIYYGIYWLKIVGYLWKKLWLILVHWIY